MYNRDLSSLNRLDVPTMMSLALTLGLILVSLLQPNSGYFHSIPHVKRSAAIYKAFFDDSIDLSSEGSGALLKRLLRRGDGRKGYPLAKDEVKIAWKIHLLDGTLVHDSKAEQGPEDEIFSFTVGAEPREVILGWEYGIKTMLEGEIAQFTIEPSYAFGVKGTPPLIQPNTTLQCEIELLSIIPALSRRFKSVGMNESIRDELMVRL